VKYQFVLIPAFAWLQITFMQFVLAMGNKPRESKNLHRFCLVYYTFTLFLIIGLALYAAARVDVNLVILVSIFAAISMYYISAFFYGEFLSMLFSSIQYFLVLPLFTIMLPMHSFCHCDDVSWGMKSGTAPSSLVGVACVADWW
jgi:chitin synthase